MEQELGIFAGEICNRNNCTGIILEREKEGCCSCHINPPCGYCVEDAAYCEKCDWSGREDQQINDANYSKPPKHIEYKAKTFQDLDKTKIDWISEGHTHFTMIKKGVYPEGTTAAQVDLKVRGTFGGRFTEFGNGIFKYIAYTD
jgi:hypothetical protein